MLFADGDGAAEQGEADRKEDEAETGDGYDLRPDDIETGTTKDNRLGKRHVVA